MFTLALDTGPGSSGLPLCELIRSLPPSPPPYLCQAPGGMLLTYLLLEWVHDWVPRRQGRVLPGHQFLEPGVLQDKLTGGGRDP